MIIPSHTPDSHLTEAHVSAPERIVTGTDSPFDNRMFCHFREKKIDRVKYNVAKMKRRTVVDMVMAVHYPLGRMERRGMKKQRESPF